MQERATTSAGMKASAIFPQGNTKYPGFTRNFPAVLTSGGL